MLTQHGMPLLHKAVLRCNAMISSRPVPVKFVWRGEQYAGTLDPLNGAGNVWYLMVDRYFKGQLVNSGHMGWAFYSNSGNFEDLGEYFGEYLTAWYQ